MLMLTSIVTCTLLVHVTSATFTTDIIAETVPELNISHAITWQVVSGMNDHACNLPKSPIISRYMVVMTQWFVNKGAAYV